MIVKRTGKGSSFGPDGRRIGGCQRKPILVCAPKKPPSSSLNLFAPRNTIKVTRAPILSGLSVGQGLLQRKFQRPMLKRRAYSSQADDALKRSCLGVRPRQDGMARLLARAGKGLHFVSRRQEDKGDGSGSDEESDTAKEPERPFDPLMVWQSPHQGGEPKGLPSTRAMQTRTDEFGIEETVSVLQAAPLARYSKENVFVPPILAKWLRPHQREGVQFMYECVMGLRDFEGQGCILADDMGLGKTLQSVALIYTLLKTGVTSNKAPSAKRVIVVCPCSLVKNWDNEFVKWLGPGAVKSLALAEADRKKVERDLDSFVNTKIFNILICSYECLRSHVGRLLKKEDCCDLLVCDEAHRLKNKDNQTSRALNSLPVKRRVLLTGTPMQNDLQEFYAMVDFTNPGVLGTQEEFRKNMLFPILRGREPEATETQKRRMCEVQEEMSSTVNDFILRRVNTLNAQHLPPKLVQVVCCNLTEIQQNMYQHLVNSKDMQHVLDGKQVNCLGSIQMLMKLCNHPSLIGDEDPTYGTKTTGRRAAAKQIKYNENDEKAAAAPGADGVSKFLPLSGGGGGRGNSDPVHPEWSGKMFVLFRLMKEMRRPGNGGDKIVIISNYTQTLDLIGRMCKQNSWGFCRLDGSVSMKKRQKMVDEFNDPSTPLIAFLLSSKAGGCGLNLIGGNRLVLFDPDWNPAVDKQAAARCWRDGQKKRCFTYRFLATGTVEEKIFQRQLSKEGLQSVVDDKEQVNELSTKDLRNLFKLRSGTPSDTHDKLKCERCKIIKDDAEDDEIKILPKKLAACADLVKEMLEEEEAEFFKKPLVPEDHGITKEDYEKVVKQPMDLSTIQTRLGMIPDHVATYKNVSSVAKDVNRIFSNVIKVWAPGDSIADASRKLQTWWLERWANLVPVLMTMKSDDEIHDHAHGGELHGDMLEQCAAMQNERGDDYQEQLGMPDEENMRAWSHHHTSDTVDDPVFRAAMRGTGSVSFVFGLEVTWSLIQQRQQDEEERKAMQELEAIEEIAEVDGDGDGGANENGDEGDDDAAETKSKVKTEEAPKQSAKVVSPKKARQEQSGSDTDPEHNDFIVADDGDENGETDISDSDDDMEDELSDEDPAGVIESDDDDE